MSLRSRKQTVEVIGVRCHSQILLLIFCLSCALPGGCHTSTTTGTRGLAQSESQSSLSRQDRLALFEEVWQTINAEYYDPDFHGVDWAAVHERYRPRIEAAANDQEVYALCETMLATLRDAHTVFNKPEPSSLEQRQKGSAGLSLAEVEGKTVVLSVDKDSDAFNAGVAPGMILRTVNDRPIEQIYAQIRSEYAGSSSDTAMKNLMHGALLYADFLGASRRLGFEGFKHERVTVSITHRGPVDASPVLTARRLESGVGYIKLDQWRPPLAEPFREELGKLMNTRGLILDLRGNGGGQTSVLLEVASNFFPKEVSFGGFKGRNGAIERIATHRVAQTYGGAVVILVDEESASASEVFTASMQENARARVVGRQTCGCVLNQASKTLSRGILRWSSRVYFSPQGRLLEGSGITPDNIVELTISDLQHHRDKALQVAESLLKAKNSGSG